MISATQVRDPQTYAIIGAAMEVYNQPGRGFLEKAYVEAAKKGSLPFLAVDPFWAV